MSGVSNLPIWYWAVMGALLGGTIASFLGVVLERVPRGVSVNGRSRCACGRQLRWHENVPVLGWLRIRGTAPCCGARLPVGYLFGELAGTIVLGALGALTGPLGIGAGCTIALVVTTLIAHRRRRRGALPTAADGGR